MSRTFVIAEAGSTHDNQLKTAHNLIDAAKACGADAVKWQFWSSSKALAARRKIPQAEPIYAKYKLPVGWLQILSEHCQRVGIEFMCSTFLLEDIPTVAPYVTRFKISAFESEWEDFVNAHWDYAREVICSVNPGKWFFGNYYPRLLHCISEYPTRLEDLKLSRISEFQLDGLSDHSTSVLSGACAVHQGATIIEKHIRLSGCDPLNPDYPHSLVADTENPEFSFKGYVDLIREAERML